MQLNITTDYAIRIMLHLASSGSVLQSRELGRVSNVSQGYVLKIMRQLIEKGFVEQHRGAQGGYSIGMDPKDITLFDIIDTMEPTTKINRCIEDDRFCSRKAVPSCTVHNVYLYVQEQLESIFSSISLKDVLEGNIQFLGHMKTKLKGV